MKKNNGITLIALIVTIIILLILAGVALNLITGSDGILGKATKAVDEHNNQSAKEEFEMLVSEAKMAYFADYDENSKMSFMDFFKEYTKDKENINVDDNGSCTFIDSNGKENHFMLKEDGSVQETEILKITAITVENMELEEGAISQLKVTTTPNTTGIERLEYISSDPNIATVASNGEVKGISEGTTTITVTGKVSTNVSGSCTVTVVKGVPVVGEKAFDNDENTYEIVQNETKKMYLSKDLLGQTVTMSIQTRYGRGNNSTSIYFYDLEGQKIEDTGTKFYYEGGTTTTGVYSYVIPENCSYIEFWAGDGPYGPYIYLYEIQVGMGVEITSNIESYPNLKENNIELGKVAINLKPEKNIERLMYKIDEEEWKDCTRTLKVTGGNTIYVKGIDKDGKETLEPSWKELPGLLSQNISDGNDNTYEAINTGENARLYTDSSAYGKNINIKLKTRYGRGADYYGAGSNATHIYFYDLEGQKIENVGTDFQKAGGTTTAGVYSYTIPENCSYIEFWVGDGSYKPYMYLYEISVE